MEIDIDSLSEDQLIQLNHRVIARLKFLESMHAHAEMFQFNIGQKVSFQPSGRDRQIGALIKYNKKTVTILTESGQRWNVSPHLLSAVKDIKAGHSDISKVIDIKSKQ